MRAPWHIGLLLPALLLLAGSAPAWADETQPEGEDDVIWVDVMPSRPPVEVRLAEITRRVQEAVVYPQRAREQGTTGVSQIQFQITAEGRASHVQLVESSGSKLLDGAAAQGARDARELPYVFGRIRIPIRFDLESQRR